MGRRLTNCCNLNHDCAPGTDYHPRLYQRPSTAFVGMETCGRREAGQSHRPIPEPGHSLYGCCCCFWQGSGGVG